MSAAAMPMPMENRLPHSVETEQAVIGCLIADNRSIPLIQSVLQPEDFYHAPHPELMEAAYKIHGEGRPVTPLTLFGELTHHAGLREIGGHAYMANLAGAAPVENPVPLARIVADLARRRDAVIALAVAEDEIHANRPLDAALEPVVQISRRATVSRQRRASISETTALLLKEAEDSARGVPIPSVTTGLKSLDAHIGGLQAGDFCIYAGRPGMGKSALLAATGLAAARFGRPAILFSLEMTQKSLLQRLGCDLDYSIHPDSPLSYSWFRDGRANRHQIERMALALREIPEHFEIHEDGLLTVHRIAALSEAFASQHKVMGVVVIDYLQKIRASDRYAGNKVQEVTEISGALKALALKLGWPVVAGAQLNRGVESRGEQRPMLSDLRESGAIEQDADQVIGLYREAYYVQKREPALKHSMEHANWESEYENVKHRLDLAVLKNRHGADGLVSVFCDMRASAVRDAVPEKDARYGA